MTIITGLFKPFPINQFFLLFVIDMMTLFTTLVFQNINMEIMFKCRKNYKISEVPIRFLSRKSGRSKAGSFAGVIEALRIVRYIIELRFGLR